MTRIFSLLLTTLVVSVVCRPAVADELYGTLKKISDSGVVSIGYRESSVPFSFLDEQRDPRGYSIDLCLEIVARVREVLGKEVDVEYVAVNPQNRIPMLLDGTIDMECGSTTNSLSRQRQVDYTHITFITGTKLLVKRNSGIREVEDLDGKSMALTRGTTNEEAINAVKQEKGLDLRLLPVKDHAEGFQALKAGRVDAYCTDHVLLHGLISRAEEPEDYVVVGRFLSYDPYAIMLRRDDAAFRLVANTTLSDLFRSRDIDGIYAKWFDPLGVPVTYLLEAAFELQALPR